MLLRKLIAVCAEDYVERYKHNVWARRGVLKAGGVNELLCCRRLKCEFRNID
jgi:hypothetical protein